MTPSGRATRIVVAVSVALLAAYAIVWTHVSPFDIGRSDFSAFYVGGTLLREGDGASLYDESLQAPLHARLIAPDREGNLPFVDPPVAAALVLPVTLLGLGAAYRLWALVELAILALAVVIAATQARARVPRASRWAAGLAALAGVGTLFATAQAQWTPVLALGLAVAYWSWQRRDQRPSRSAALGAACLVACALVGKPQLALGLLAFMAGWRRRAVVLGGLAALAAVAAVSFALVGAAGIAGLARIVAGSTTRWDLHQMLGVSGVAAAITGGGAAAVALGAALSLAACGAAFVLGSRVRRDQSRLAVALAGAAALSLLAAPHAYLDDLAVLAPAAAWCLTATVNSSAAGGGSRWRSAHAVVLALWVAVNAAGICDLALQGRLPVGPVSSYVLALVGAVALAATRDQAAVRLRYRAGDEAPLGAVAHGLRRG